MQITVTNLRLLLKKRFGKEITRQGIHAIIKSVLVEGTDYNYLTPRLIVINGRGINKIFKKLKLKK